MQRRTYRERRCGNSPGKVTAEQQESTNMQEPPCQASNVRLIRAGYTCHQASQQNPAAYHIFHSRRLRRSERREGGGVTVIFQNAKSGNKPSAIARYKLTWNEVKHFLPRTPGGFRRTKRRTGSLQTQTSGSDSPRLVPLQGVISNTPRRPRRPEQVGRIALRIPLSKQ